jgi:hypothetical protein
MTSPRPWRIAPDVDERKMLAPVPRGTGGDLILDANGKSVLGVSEWVNIERADLELIVAAVNERRSGFAHSAKWQKQALTPAAQNALSRASKMRAGESMLTLLTVWQHRRLKGGVCCDAQGSRATGRETR